MATQAFVDPGMVQETHLQIRGLVAEVAELARSAVEAAEFNREVLTRLVSALAAVGGAVWTIENDLLSLEYQVNLPEVGLPDEGDGQQRHARLLNDALSATRGLLVPPHAAATGDEQAGNPTRCLLILAPLASDDRQYGVIEIFQRPGGSVVTQRGYLRFVLEICELAGDYLKRRELREFVGRQALWSQLEEFCRAVHGNLDARRTALVVANEGRRLIGCDRLSVAIAHGRTTRLAAISGQESFDRRATAVRLLDRLIKAVAAGGEPVWYSGDNRDLAPQVESALQEYVDQTEHSKTVGVLPLMRPLPPGAAERPGVRPEIVGAVVVEQFQQSRMPDGMLDRVRVVREHSALAVANALEHDGLFLMPLWRAIGRCRWVVEARALPKTVMALVGALLLIGAFAFIPADFDLEARGVLQPVVRRDVFVRESGVVSEVFVEHGQRIHAGDPLVQLRSRDLEVSIADLVGRRKATGEQMLSLARARNESRLGIEDQSRLAGQLKQLEKTSEGLGLQLALLLKKQELLRLNSPIDGQVVTWDVKNRLEERPVEKGQILMSVANPDGKWELELHVREDRMGHVARAWQEAQAAKDALPVNYILATAPSRRRDGQVQSIDSIAEVRGDEGNTVLVRVAIDRQSLDPAEMRPGASVTARIHCGRRSLGYVWFHDVMAAISSRILFRL